MIDKTILVVEDEVDIREAIKEALLAAGYQVLTAKNGKEGLVSAITHEPDLILLDLNMSVMNGHEVLTKLRQHPWGRSASILILSSLDDVKNIASAYQDSITDYLIKSHFSLKELVNKVREALYTSS